MLRCRMGGRRRALRGAGRWELTLAAFAALVASAAAATWPPGDAAFVSQRAAAASGIPMDLSEGGASRVRLRQARAVEPTESADALETGESSAPGFQPESEPRQTPGVASSAPSQAPNAGLRQAGTAISLAVFVRDALQYNIALQAARAGTESVQTGILEAKSIFEPFLQLSPSYSRTEFSSLLPPGQANREPTTASGIDTGKGVGSGLSGTLPLSTSYSARLDWNQQNQENLLLAQGLQPQSNTSLTLELTQPLLRGFGPFIAQAPVTQAILAADSAGAQYNRLTEQIVADVEQAYWTVGLAAAIERLSRDSYDRARELLRRNERMQELELITEVDLVTSRRGVQQRLTSLTNAIRQRQDAVQRLYFLVYGDQVGRHLPPDMALATESPPSSLPGLLPLERLEQTALAARDDVEAALLDLESRDVTRRTAKNALLPDLSLRASYTTQTIGVEGFRLSGVERVGDADSQGWRVGVEISYPLFNRAARAQHARAGFDYEVQQRALANIEVGVRNQVRLAERALRVQYELVQQAGLAFQYAGEQYGGAQRQLQLGLVDSFRLLQVEEEVVSAELVFEQARYDFALALSAFELAMGSITEKYLASLPASTPSSEPAPE